MRIPVLAAVLLFAAFPAHAARDALPKLLEFDDRNQYADWPVGALQRGLEGRAILECEVNTEGGVENCTLLSETPAGEGFGAAALRAAARYRFEPGRKDGKAVRSSVRLPMWFSLPLDTPPDWVKKPTSEEMKATWPADAARKGIEGHAILQCVVSLRGTLEGCDSIWDDPPGMGFGDAALLLTPTFLMKPGKRNGQPVSSPVRIPITFKTDGGFSGVRINMITNAVWASAPGFADMAAAWPAKAKADSGHVSMRCAVSENGGLKNCDVLTETPSGQGFARAARSLLPKFKLRLEDGLPPNLAKAKINLPIRFANPTAKIPRSITEPKWITKINPEKILAVYPDAAVKAGVKSGRGVANCMVAADGRLTDCRPGPAAPEGLGFSEAAVQVASLMVMNPWTDGGGPVDGVRLKLPVTFNLAPEEDAAPAKP